MTDSDNDGFDDISRHFGPDATEAFLDWLGRSRRVINVAPQGEGESGGVVLGVLVNDPTGRTSFQLVIKLTTDPESALRAERAWKEAGTFERHLAEHLATLHVDGVGAVVVQRVGGDDLRGRAVLSSPSWRHEQLVEQFSVVVEAVLTRWGRAECLERLVHAFLRENLGDRVEPGGKVWRWAAPAGLLDARVDRVLLPPDSRPLSNPFLLLRASGPGGLRVVGARYGKTHSDLHPGNILACGDPWGFTLVDLERYETLAPMSRDITHLLLSLLARELPKFSAEERGSLISELVGDRHTSDPLPASIRSLISRFTEKSEAWLEGKGVTGEWRVQKQLSLVACALMFTGRERHRADGTWLWFLRLAARAAESFLADHGAVPEEGEICRIAGIDAERWGEANTRHLAENGLAWKDLLVELKASWIDDRGWRVFDEGTCRLGAALGRLGPLPPGLPIEAMRYVEELREAILTARRPTIPAEVWTRVVGRVRRLRQALVEILTTFYAYEVE